MRERSIAGYLVVLKTSEYRSNVNPRYRGIDRIPAYPSSFPEEMPILDEYVFGPYKDPETNLIPTVDLAMDLYSRLQVSRRSFDILYCTTCPDSTQRSLETSGETMTQLGHDVAVLQGDYWSIVEDMPSSEWALPYRIELNDNGLFESHDFAQSYLKEYRGQKEADFDNAFDALSVAHLLLGK